MVRFVLEGMVKAIVVGFDETIHQALRHVTYTKAKQWAFLE